MDLAPQPEFAPEVVQYDRPVPTPWKMAVELRVKNPSASWKEVAKSLGYSHQTLLIWAKKPEFQRYENFVLQRILPDLPVAVELERKAVMQRVAERFETHAEEMQERLLTILETTEDTKLQAAIAQDWLDRTGAGAKRPNDSRGFAVIMSEELLERFMLRAGEAGVELRGSRSEHTHASVVDGEVMA